MQPLTYNSRQTPVTCLCNVVFYCVGDQGFPGMKGRAGEKGNQG